LRSGLRLSPGTFRAKTTIQSLVIYGGDPIIVHKKLNSIGKVALAQFAVERRLAAGAFVGHWHRPGSSRPGLELAFALCLGLAACVSQPKSNVASSRDVRSQEYCSLRAQAAGYAKIDVGSACRRAEYVAKTRAQLTRIQPSLDRDCEEVATVGQAGGPFSWGAYMHCIDNSI
jgi:hypothetical protein